MNVNAAKPSPESLLAKLQEDNQARLRVYLGAAPGVGKTYQMLQDAHALKRQGVDVVIGFVETHGRAETADLVRDLECAPLREIPYRGVTLREMDVEALLARRPAVVVVDELAHTNAPGSANCKRYKDALALLAAGLTVYTAVNVQHLESLNDVVARVTGVRVRETVPDCFLRRADEVINVDVSVDTLRTRLRQGKIYGVEKIEQSLNNFFRKGNLTALRELALRETAQEQAAKAHDYREREGLEQAVIPDKVMVCISSRGNTQKLLRVGSRLAGRLANDWHAVYVQTAREAPACIKPQDRAALEQTFALAAELGAQIVTLTGENVADELIRFAREHGVTQVIFGQSARSRWEILWRGSVINRFLAEVADATVQVVPLKDNSPHDNIAA